MFASLLPPIRGFRTCGQCAEFEALRRRTARLWQFCPSKIYKFSQNHLAFLQTLGSASHPLCATAVDSWLAEARKVFSPISAVFEFGISGPDRRSQCRRYQIGIPFHIFRVFRLHHDARQRLGPRIAQHHAPRRPKRFFRFIKGQRNFR